MALVAVLVLVVAVPLTAASAAPEHSGGTLKAALPWTGLNSAGADFEITYSADGKTAVFASSRPGGLGGNDVYTSELVGGEWTTPVNVGPAVNSAVNEQEASLSDDGRVLYFTRYTSALNGDLYVSRKVDGVWQKAESWNDEPALPALNTPDSEEHCPIIVTRDLIYFSHDVPGVTQKSDVWQVERANGVWGQPRPLPGDINSPYRDHVHWTGLSKDGKALIVVSDRPDRGSFGGSDEWISRRDGRGRWSLPRNLGARVNSSAAEVCWTFTPDGLRFAGASSKDGGQGLSDLYWTYARDVPLLRGFEPVARPPIDLLP
jgi:hypothetical protein